MRIIRNNFDLSLNDFFPKQSQCSRCASIIEINCPADIQRMTTIDIRQPGVLKETYDYYILCPCCNRQSIILTNVIPASVRDAVDSHIENNQH